MPLVILKAISQGLAIPDDGCGEVSVTNLQCSSRKATILLQQVAVLLQDPGGGMSQCPPRRSQGDPFLLLH